MKAKPPAKLENVNDEPNVAQSPLPRSGSVQQITAANAGWPLSVPLSRLTSLARNGEVVSVKQ